MSVRCDRRAAWPNGCGLHHQRAGTAILRERTVIVVCACRSAAAPVRVRTSFRLAASFDLARTVSVPVAVGAFCDVDRDAVVCAQLVVDYR